MVRFRTVIVLAIYNEEASLLSLVDQIERVAQESGLGLDIVAVDDGSTDGTAEKLRALKREWPNIYVVRHEKNEGMAAALKTGIQRALESDCEALVFMDADGTHDPADIPRFLQALEDGYDFVIGSRFMPGGGMVDVPRWRVIMSKVGNLLGRVVLRLPVKDATSGYRAGSREVFETISLDETGFPIQLEETIKIAAAGSRLTEIPIVLTHRNRGESKFRVSPNLIVSYGSVLLKGLRWQKRS